jgi:hypothetical protein
MVHRVIPREPERPNNIEEFHLNRRQGSDPGSCGMIRTLSCACEDVPKILPVESELDFVEAEIFAFRDPLVGRFSTMRGISGYASTNLPTGESGMTGMSGQSRPAAAAAINRLRQDISLRRASARKTGS